MPSRRNRKPSSPSCSLTDFHELNLDLTLPPLPVPPAPSFPSVAHASSLAPSPTVSPTLSHASRPHAPAQTQNENIDLTSLEARKRAELVARKAALKARNEQRALSLETELESLFSAAVGGGLSPVPPSFAAASSSSSSSPVPAPDGPRIDHGPTRKRVKLDLAAPPPPPLLDVHSLRSSLDHTEEVAPPSGVPSGGPFPSSSSSSSSFPAVGVSSASSRSLPPTVPPSRRPTAIDMDLEAEPTRAATGRSGYGFHGAPAYLARAQAMSMVIELSDSEEDGEEDDEDGVGGDAEMKGEGNQDGPPMRAPSPAVPPAVAELTVEEDERRRQLQIKEKDLELKRLKERIAALESRKKKDAGSSSTSTSRKASAEPEGKGGGDGLSAPGARVGEVEKGERRGAVEEDEVMQEGGEGATQESLVADEPGSAPTQPRCPAGKSPAHPFVSPRGSLLSGKEGWPDRGSAGLHSWAARKHGVEPSRRWCKAEAGGGTCKDRKCKSVHVAQFGASEEELAEYESLRAASIIAQ
ncbi:hypothetical protein JCM11251_003190 [Rhodosporidiobolus azoricus]